MAIEFAKENAKDSYGLIEKTIDPEKYLIGPNDGFAISINTFEPVELELRVDPEGYLLIPSVGSILLDKLNLTDAKEAIEKKVKEVYQGSDVFVSLNKIKKFKVRISGVPKSQIVTATSTDRVSEIIDKIGGLKTESSLRNIVLERSELDTVIQIDLQEFYFLNMDESNPYLMGGDHIIVRDLRDDESIIVSGEIYEEEIGIEYSEGDSLSKIIRLAGGFTSVSKLDSVEYYEFNEADYSYKKHFLDLSEWENLLDKPYKDYDNDFPVGPKDRVYIRRVRNYQKENYVVIEGEVPFPGRYNLKNDEMWLSDLIEYSGGINEDGNKRGIRIIRQENVPSRNLELERLQERTLADMSRSERYYYQVTANGNKGYVSLNIEELLENPKSDKDIILVSKDSVIVPKFKDYVNVQGKVLRPGIIKFQEGLTYKDYIDLAGGYTANAEKGETSIRKESGEQFLAKQDDYVVERGDLIMVPEKPYVDNFEIFLRWVTVFTQVVTVVSIILLR
jgi:protein involved in polysaccharide export with SLBB domain